MTTFRRISNERWRPINGVRKSVALDATVATLVALLCTGIAAWTLGYDTTPLSIPVNYSGDGLYYGLLAKGILDNGWYLHNPYLGAPFGLDMGLFPMADDTHFAMLWLIGKLAGDFGSTLTTFYLLSFATAAIAGYAAMRWIGLQRSFAACGAILFSLQSYHFFRVAHLFLASYFCLPIFVACAMTIFRAGSESRTSWKTYLTFALLLVVASGCGVYYALFGCIVIGFAATSAGIESMEWRPVRLGVAAGAIIFITVTMNLAPHLYAIQTRTPDGAIATRAPQESEYYGLRLIQMAIPSALHRSSSLRSKAITYGKAAPQVTENQMASLGFIGFLGFLISLACALLVRPDQNPILKRLGTLNLVSFLYGTIGGVSALFAWTLTAQFRAPNRISILIAFISICAILLFAQDRLKQVNSKPARMGITTIIILALAAFGIWDQVPAKGTTAALSQGDFIRDKESGEAIMSALPAGSRVYQLPYIAFPEAAPLYGEGHTGLARRYLHTRGISWSYGTMKFGEGDQWIRKIESLPLSERVAKLKGSGFDAILVERRAYPDQGASVEDQLRQLLGSPKMVCPDGSCSIFSLDSPDLEQGSPLLTAALGSGFATPGFGAQIAGRAIPIGSEFNLVLLNPLRRKVRARIYVPISTQDPTIVTTNTEDSMSQKSQWHMPEETAIDMQIELLPGENTLTVRWNSARSRVNAAAPENLLGSLQIGVPLIGPSETESQRLEFSSRILQSDKIFSVAD
ncbi:MAG: hypothetical protein KDA57_20135 [Planctomycetales bacterium]|nr:hypothetical protein [Planctomycetales bacterium]